MKPRGRRLKRCWQKWRWGSDGQWWGRWMVLDLESLMEVKLEDSRGMEKMEQWKVCRNFILNIIKFHCFILLILFAWHSLKCMAWFGRERGIVRGWPLWLEVAGAQWKHLGAALVRSKGDGISKSESSSGEGLCCMLFCWWNWFQLYRRDAADIRWYLHSKVFTTRVWAWENSHALCLWLQVMRQRDRVFGGE